MKYTFSKSKDGQMRTTVNLEVRLTRPQLEDISEAAKAEGVRLDDYLLSCLAVGLYQASVVDQDKPKAQKQKG